MTDQPFTARFAHALRRFVAVPFDVQTYRNLAYLALAFPLGLAYFVGVTVGLSMGAGLLITWVGLPIIVATVALATIAAGFEAQLVERLLGMEAPLPEVLREFDAEAAVAVPGDGFLASVKRLLVAPTTWTSVFLLVGKFAFGVVAFTALVTAWSVAVATIGAPLVYDASHATYYVGPYVIDTLAEAVALSAAGVLFALASLHVLNGLARLGGLLTTSLLSVDRQAV